MDVVCIAWSVLIWLLALGLALGCRRLQPWLPLNPQGMAAVSPDSAFNTAVSFVANTNRQGCGGETTMSCLTQMLVLTVQNFLSAATGIAVVAALLRGFARHSAAAIGNVWVDLTRITLWILLPLALVFALVFAALGVIQNLSPYQEVPLLEAVSRQQPKAGPDGQPLADDAGTVQMEQHTRDTQTLAMGPVASQLASKLLGTSGGGFFNADSAHPFENPNAASNFLEMLAIFLIRAARVFVCVPRVSALERADRDAARPPAVGDPVGGELRRADHRRADSAGARGRALPRGRCGSAAAVQSAHLRPGPACARWPSSTPKGRCRASWANPGRTCCG